MINFYHYTSIDALSLILESEKIRFTRADLVNDLQEINAADNLLIKSSTFVSCWTCEENESIPLWGLYSDKFKGIRLKLNFPIFRNVKSSEYIKNHDCSVMIFNCPPLEMTKDEVKEIGNFVQRGSDKEWIRYIFGPIMVNYVDDNTVEVENKNGGIDVSKVGTLKSKSWDFEKEARFLILANHDWNSSINEFQFKNHSLHSHILSKYVDIPIDKEILDNIEITLGPNCGSSQFATVKSLIKKHTKDGKVFESSLKGKVKFKL